MPIQKLELDAYDVLTGYMDEAGYPEVYAGHLVRKLNELIDDVNDLTSRADSDAHG